jgi:hypothetical protein
MLAKRCTLPYNYLVTFVSWSTLVAPAIPVAIPATAATAPAAAVLPSTPTASPAAALFGPVAAFAVNRTISTGFKGHRCRLATTGANHGSASAHAGAGAPTRAVTAAFML